MLIALVLAWGAWRADARDTLEARMRRRLWREARRIGGVYGQQV